MPPRRSHAFALLLATTLLGHVSLLSAQDFDPAGRRKRPAAAAPRSPQAPSPPKPSSAEPSRDALIARYFSIVLTQPGAPFPLQRLAQLYRERDGHAKGLIQDLEARLALADKDAYAAKVALAGALRWDGRVDDAIRTYVEAIEERPKETAPLLALATLHRELGRLEEARARYEQSLAHVRGAEREEVLRILLTLSLDLRDYEAAERTHRLLVNEHPASFYIRGELARELLARGEDARAEDELRRLLKMASSDHRTLLPVLRDLGQALARQGKDDEALAIFERAEKVAGSASGIRNEIFERVVELHRKRGELPIIIEKLEKERSRDVIRAKKLGELYEEAGRADDALQTYERALRLDANDVDLRLKLIHLLHARGALERAIREYEALIRIAPRNTDYVFELAATLIQRGERERAIATLADVERRMRGNPDALARLVEFYDSIGEKEKALVLSKKLSASSRDPFHVIDLGERYWQEGDRKRALEVWSRIRLIVPNRARAQGILGEVYLNHDMPDEALAVFEEAAKLEAGHLGHRKALATALERTAAGANPKLASERYERALAIWQDLLEQAGQDARLAREARTHIVTIWALTKKIDAEIPKLRARFAHTPPDLEAGRLLAEAQLRIRRFDDATTTLARLAELGPGDIETLLSLERVHVLLRDLDQAIEVSKKIALADPRRAREAYRKMAEYAAELYRDDEALLYAEKAVALSPDDAEGHRKLGEMYRKRQDIEKAIFSFRTALSKNDLAYAVYFDLAELLVAKGQVEEADGLYRRILRACPDDAYVLRAARQSIELNIAQNSLETVEKDLLPLVLGNPRKVLHRRILVEVYGEMSLPSMQALAHGDAGERERAREVLREVGRRALKPLLDALADSQSAQQRIAIELLAFVENKTAASALFTFAIGEGDAALREQAMIVCGKLRDPSLLASYRALLLPEDLPPAPGDRVVLAAAWGLSRMAHPQARPLLSSLLTKGSMPVRALAALGLAELGNESANRELVHLANSPNAEPTSRAAAAMALAKLGAKEAPPALITLARGDDIRARQASLLALSRMQAEPAEDVIAEALFSTEASLRETAEKAAILLEGSAMQTPFDPLALPEGRLDLAAMLMGGALPDAAPEARARALVRLGPSLRRAAISRAMTSPEQASIIAHTLTALSELGAALQDAGLARAVEETTSSLTQALVPVFVSLERHPSIEVRRDAIRFLAGIRAEAAQAAVLDALSDPEKEVTLAALSALTPVASPEIVDRVIALLESSPDWPIRSRAAEALGRIGNEQAIPPGLEALKKAAREDASAFVREAALRALAHLDRERAASTLEAARASDEEPRIRELAARLLETSPS